MGDRTDVGGGGVATFATAELLAAIRGADGPRRSVVAAFAAAARLNALGMIQLAGSGHIGSSFSSLDLVSWLHLEHLGPHDIYFSSKGHDAPGLYAVLVGLGRLPFPLVTRLRRLGGLPGHPDVGTPGVPFNTGSLGMGVSKAKGLLLADRIAGRDPRRVVVLTGDGELQEGQVWESLATAVRDRLEGLTVVVDRNRLQSDLPVSAVSDLGDLAARFRAFGWRVDAVDGHDLDAIAATLGDGAPGPRVVIADTVKSRGVPFLEPGARPADERFYPFHSGALTPDVYARARDVLLDALEASCAAIGIAEPATVDLRRDDPVAWPPAAAGATTAGAQRLVPAYGRALLAAAEHRPDLVVLDADLMVDLALDGFRDAHPERFVEAGIAEQDMVSMASGLAAGGMLPVVHSFAAFLSARPMEQAVNAASERRRVAYVAGLAGLLPAGPGHSHQGVQDIAAFDRIGATVVAPSSERAVADAVAFLVDHPGNVYLRLCSVAADLPFQPVPLPPVGQGVVVHAARDRDTLLIAYGPVLLGEAVRAVDGDADLAARVEVVDLPWVNAVDPGWLRSASRGCRRVVVLDDHDARSGLGVRVAALMATSGIPLRVDVVGVEGLPECGAPAEVLAHHGLDAAAIAARLRAD